MAENKRQHAVPRLYLNLFANPDGLVHVKEPKAGKVFSASPINLGVESECFTLWDNDERNTSCDNVNQTLKNWVAPHLQSLDADLVPTTEQWRAIWILTANLITRSRRTRDETSKQTLRIAQIAQEMAPILREKMPSPLTELFNLTKENLDDTPEILRRAASIQYPLTVAGAVEGIAGDLAVKPCGLLIVPSNVNVNFITSDDPPIALENGVSVPLKIASDFVRSHSVQILLPLTPRLACLWGAASEFERRQVSAEQVREMNQLTIDSCYRHVFASQQSDLNVQ